MISPQARIVRAFLRASSAKKNYSDDKIALHRAAFEKNAATLFKPVRGVKILPDVIDGVNVAWITTAKSTDRTIIYLHGGGFVLGSLTTHQQHMGRLAKLCKAKVLAIDYSLAPEHPYPTQIDEIERVWKAELEHGLNTNHTVVMGDSAGGNLALAALLRFRERHVPQPACLVMLSPALDATASGPTHKDKTIKDAVLNPDKIEFFTRHYSQGTPRDNPNISPLFADLKNLPPFLVHVGSQELLLSDSQIITERAKRDGVDVELYVGKGMWHGWHFFAGYVPEAKAAMQAVADYVISRTS